MTFYVFATPLCGEERSGIPPVRLTNALVDSLAFGVFGSTGDSDDLFRFQNPELLPLESANVCSHFKGLQVCHSQCVTKEDMKLLYWWNVGFGFWCVNSTSFLCWKHYWSLGMPTVPVYTADTGTIYTGPYLYRQAFRLLVYGMVYGTAMARKTRSIIRLYGRKYSISFRQH